MYRPLQPRVSVHYRALSAASPTRAAYARGSTGSFHVWMLQQDLDQQHYAYETRLEYDGVDHQQGDAIISDLLRELGHHRHDNAARVFNQLVSVVAREHLGYGKCLFEFYQDESGESPSPRLGVLPGWSLRHRRKGTFQGLPRAGEVEWRQLPTVALAEFRLPGQLGRELYQTRKRLQVLDAHRAGGPSMFTRARSTGYDLEAHQLQLDEMAARVTRSIGWHGRDSFLRRATDSYRIYRKLCFLRTWLTIVAATTATLDRVCRHPAVNDGMPVRVRVTGLPAIEDVEYHLSAVIDGTESLDDIFRNVLHPRHN